MKKKTTKKSATKKTGKVGRPVKQVMTKAKTKTTTRSRETTKAV
jgi:hypothetical protein